MTHLDLLNITLQRVLKDNNIFLQSEPRFKHYLCSDKSEQYRIWESYMFNLTLTKEILYFLPPHFTNIFKGEFIKFLRGKNIENEFEHLILVSENQKWRKDLGYDYDFQSLDEYLNTIPPTEYVLRCWSWGFHQSIRGSALHDQWHKRFVNILKSEVNI